MMLSKKLKRFWLKNLKSKNVSYNKDREEIKISKGIISVTLKAVFRVENCNDYIMQISGDSIVVENEIIRSIWTALWNTKIAVVDEQGQIVEETVAVSDTAEESEESEVENVFFVAPTYKTIFFCDVRVHSCPNFLKIQKDEIISID